LISSRTSEHKQVDGAVFGATDIREREIWPLSWAEMEAKEAGKKGAGEPDVKLTAISGMEGHCWQEAKKLKGTQGSEKETQGSEKGSQELEKRELKGLTERVCYTSHKKGHIASNCTQAKRCYICGTNRHLAKRCPQAP
jgi:hypothetical protein